MTEFAHICVGSDHAGVDLKQFIKSHLVERGLVVSDFGVAVGERGHYPLYAESVARAVVSNERYCGLLFCGSGVGISIAANKVRGVRCVVCSEPYSALMARQHNNANILALGQRVVGVELALLIVNTFLSGKFEGGRHEERIAMISRVELGLPPTHEAVVPQE